MFRSFHCRCLCFLRTSTVPALFTLHYISLSFGTDWHDRCAVGYLPLHWWHVQVELLSFINGRLWFLASFVFCAGAQTGQHQHIICNYELLYIFTYFVWAYLRQCKYIILLVHMLLAFVDKLCSLHSVDERLRHTRTS